MYCAINGNGGGFLHCGISIQPMSLVGQPRRFATTRYLRFTLNSDRIADMAERPFRAMNGLMHCNKPVQLLPA